MLPARRSWLTPPICLLLAAVGTTNAPGNDSLLPAQLDGWKRVEQMRVEAPELERLAGEPAALLREYGNQRAERGVYRRGAAVAWVTVHEMQDHSSAYGAFTLLRAGGQGVRLGEAAARTGPNLVFYQGKYFVRVEGAIAVAALRPLARDLKAQSGAQPSLPTLPYYLPRRGLVAASERYLLGALALARAAPLAPGDWVGFAYGAEVEAARYQLDAKEATLLLINYPTPQIAAARLRDFQRFFNLNGTGDPLRPLAYAKRLGTLVVLVAGVDSGRAAAGLMEQVRYEAELSWSEPSELKTEANWAVTLLNIFIGTGLILLVALLSGLAFAGLRLLITRLLPGRLFDRPKDDVIILNLRDRR